MTNSVLDAEPLLIAFEGDRAGVGELLELSLTTLAEELHALHTAIGSSDLDRIAGLAHGLKGSAANVGAAEFSTLCATLESNAHSGEPGRLHDGVAALETALDRLRDAVAAFDTSGP